MTRRCLRCGEEIPATDVNAETGLALCRRCGETLALSDVVEAAELEDVDFSEPPGGVTIDAAGHRLTITARPPWWHALILLPFAVAWNSFIWFVVVLLVSDYVSGKMEISDAGACGVAAFLLPFVAVGLGLVYGMLLMLFGNVRVTLDRDVLKVYTGVFGIGRTKKAAWCEVTGVHLRESSGRGASKRVEIDCPKPIHFGSALLESRVRFIAAVLRRMLQERDNVPIADPCED